MHPKSQTLLEVHIFMGKTGRENKRYSAEFKIGVIIDKREHQLGYRTSDFTHILKKNHIFHYYNNEHIFLKLKGMSPVQYRTHSLAI